MCNSIPDIKVLNSLKDDSDFQEAAYIFANDVRTLRDALSSNRNLPQYSYDLFRAGGVVRRLLLDGHSLANYTARKLGMKVWVVKWCRNGPDTECDFDQLPKIYQEFAPRMPDGPPMLEQLSRRAYSPSTYLSMRIGIVERHKLTPKLVVKLLANKLGGTHFDRRFREKERELEDIFNAKDSLKIGGTSHLILFAEAVIFDVYHACYPILRILIDNEVIPQQSGTNGNVYPA